MASSRGVRYANEMPFELLTMMWNVGKRRGLTRKWVAELVNRPSTDRQNEGQTPDHAFVSRSNGTNFEVDNFYFAPANLGVPLRGARYEPRFPLVRAPHRASVCWRVRRRARPRLWRVSRRLWRLRRGHRFEA